MLLSGTTQLLSIEISVSAPLKCIAQWSLRALVTINLSSRSPAMHSTCIMICSGYDIK